MIALHNSVSAHHEFPDGFCIVGDRHECRMINYRGRLERYDIDALARHLVGAVGEGQLIPRRMPIARCRGPVRFSKAVGVLNAKPEGLSSFERGGGNGGSADGKFDRVR